MFAPLLVHRSVLDRGLPVRLLDIRPVQLDGRHADPVRGAADGVYAGAVPGFTGQSFK